eukprot:6606463-Prorocentrum_lima.AAC.1
MECSGPFQLNSSARAPRMGWRRRIRPLPGNSRNALATCCWQWMSAAPSLAWTGGLCTERWSRNAAP